MAAAAAASSGERARIDNCPAPLHLEGVRDGMLSGIGLDDLISVGKCCRAWRAVVDDFVRWVACRDRERDRARLSPEMHAKFDAALKGENFLKFFFEKPFTPTGIRLRWHLEPEVRTPITRSRRIANGLP